MAITRVLSLDGGGIRGLLATVILQRLTATPGLETFLAAADLLAGTSTGGLIALAVARGIDLAEIRRLYEEKAEAIFDDTWLDDLVDLGRLRGAEYDIKGLRRELRRLFGETTLGDLAKPVLIPSFDLDNEDPDPGKRQWKPKLFHNLPGPGTDAGMRAADVGLYTCAAPIYFPSVDGFIDGGVYANNPAMCALAQTQDRRHGPPADLGEVRLFSLGTGLNLQHIKGKANDWGYAQWAKPLVNLMLDGTAGIADYQCRQILGDRYHRLCPIFPPGTTFPMDGVDKIPALVRFAEAVPLGDTIAWLRRWW